MNTAAVLAGYLISAGGFIAGIGALLKIGPERRKMTADAFRVGVDSAATLSKSAMDLLNPALEQVTFLRTELASSRAENAELRRQMATLTSRLTVIEDFCRASGLAVPAT